MPHCLKPVILEGDLKKKNLIIQITWSSFSHLKKKKQNTENFNFSLLQFFAPYQDEALALVWNVSSSLYTYTTTHTHTTDLSIDIALHSYDFSKPWPASYSIISEYPCAGKTPWSLPITSLSSQLRCHLLLEAFPDYPVWSYHTHPSHPVPSAF